MKCVYLLQSLSHPARRYVGITEDMDKRLANHNAGRSPHTRKHRPWKRVVAITFADDRKAEAFEACLKQGSGHAFANRRF
jgi:predicted GIY-YIG superfamily endonuclease